jgi:hypothetical protein
MNHQPFEDWLLEDQHLTAQQERDLQTHLRGCTSCSAIAGANLALRSAREAIPADGFTERFGIRLAAWRREQRWRQILGTIVLVFGGLTLLYWLTGSIVWTVLRSPSAWITAAVGYFVFFLASAHLITEVSRILLDALRNLIPPGGWLALSLVFAGLGFLWTVSLRRFTQRGDGV